MNQEDIKNEYCIKYKVLHERDYPLDDIETKENLVVLSPTAETAITEARSIIKKNNPGRLTSITDVRKV